MSSISQCTDFALHLYFQEPFFRNDYGEAARNVHNVGLKRHSKIKRLAKLWSSVYEEPNVIAFMRSPLYLVVT